MDESHVVFIEIPTINKSRSNFEMSPKSPALYRGKNSSFFEMLSRRFGRRLHDDIYFQQNGEEDARSSSTESCSSTSVQFGTRRDGLKKSCSQIVSNKQPHYVQNCMCEFVQNCESNSSSDSGSDSIENRIHAHRRSTSSPRGSIKNISTSQRSLSCSNTRNDQKIKTNKKVPSQRKCILRQPVSYVYEKGMSGLPTKRVPKSSVCYHNSTHR